MSATFIADQLQRSLRNLRVSSIDYFYLHNPEQQLGAVAPEEFRRRVRAAFEVLEQSVTAGRIRAYGCATWNGLRLPAGSQGHLSLYELHGIANDVGGKDHHFRVAQLPINLTMSEAVRISTQRDRKGRLVHVVDAAAELGIDLVASAPLLQGQLTANLPQEVREMFPGTTDAQRALAFTRSVPGVLTAAVGTRRREHLMENLGAFRAA
jgi:aryl-alcohol dehydrogenase-like predicted oxidoreductase